MHDLIFDAHESLFSSKQILKSNLTREMLSKSVSSSNERFLNMYEVIHYSLDFSPPLKKYKNYYLTGQYPNSEVFSDQSNYFG